MNNQELENLVVIFDGCFIEQDVFEATGIVPELHSLDNWRKNILNWCFNFRKITINTEIRKMAAILDLTAMFVCCTVCQKVTGIVSKSYSPGTKVN